MLERRLANQNVPNRRVARMATESRKDLIAPLVGMRKYAANQTAVRSVSGSRLHLEPRVHDTAAVAVRQCDDRARWAAGRAVRGHVSCESGGRQEGVMSHVIVPRRAILSFVVGVVEHVFFVIAGFVLMVVGMGLSVTMIMLPVGLALGLLGFAMFVGGLTVRINRS
jgi:hypothetical protein